MFVSPQIHTETLPISVAFERQLGLDEAMRILVP